MVNNEPIFQYLKHDYYFLKINPFSWASIKRKNAVLNWEILTKDYGPILIEYIQIEFMSHDWLSHEIAAIVECIF